MANTNLNIRIDENLKSQFEKLCADFGMSVTTAFTVFAKAVVREREIPLRIASEPKDPTAYWSPEQWAKIDAMLMVSEADVAAGRTMDAFDSLKQLRERHGL